MFFFCHCDEVRGNNPLLGQRQCLKGFIKCEFCGILIHAEFPFVIDYEQGYLLYFYCKRFLFMF